MLLKKLFLIFAVLLMTAFVMAEEKHMGKFATNIELNSGYEMPILGLGTWTLTGETCENAVYAALKSGYRLQILSFIARRIAFPTSLSLP